MSDQINIIGAGLAGCEAAFQVARRGARARLFEMRPAVMTPAHKSGLFAELVCSNSLGNNSLQTAPGLLKKELTLCGSLIMEAAGAAKLPAGGALAVDREKFAAYITDTLLKQERVKVERREVKDLDDLAAPLIVASGPLTAGSLAAAIEKLCKGSAPLYFYDAAAPVLQKESINLSRAFFASRYDKGGADYINCPMDKDEYLAFRHELIHAGLADLHGFEEKKIYFEGCMPIEELARRGEDAMRFGPLKPVGLINPQTGKEAYAVAQLRQDDAAASAYNLVGFQTRLKWPEQKRVFGMIPGLEGAQFLRYGVMHRNSFIDSPRLLNACYALRSRPGVFFAGQLTGVEGYMESTASGLVAGLNAARLLLGKSPAPFPKDTAIGALSAYISDDRISAFQPMNINFGLFSPLPQRVKNKQDKKTKIAERALSALNEYIGGQSYVLP